MDIEGVILLVIIGAAFISAKRYTSSTAVDFMNQASALESSYALTDMRRATMRAARKKAEEANKWAVGMSIGSSVLSAITQMATR